MSDFDYVGSEFRKLSNETPGLCVRVKVTGEHGETRHLSYPVDALPVLLSVIRNERKLAGLD